MIIIQIKNKNLLNFNGLNGNYNKIKWLSKNK